MRAKVEIAGFEKKEQEKFFMASRRGDWHRVHRGLTLGCNVDLKDNLGLSALHYAVRSGNIRCVEGLLDAGADVNASSGNDRRTPLYEAIDSNGSLSLVRVLVHAGADTDWVDNDSIGSVTFCALKSMQWEQSEAEIGLFLIGSGANASVRNRYDVHPLLFLATRVRASAQLLRFAEEIIKFQLQLDGGLSDDFRKVLLLSFNCTAAHGNESMMKFLIRWGADPLSKVARQGVRAIDLVRPPLLRDEIGRYFLRISCDGAGKNTGHEALGL